MTERVARDARVRWLFAFVVLASACRAPNVDVMPAAGTPLPTLMVASQGPDVLVVCDKGLFSGRLTGDERDSRLVWLTSPTGDRLDVDWPIGFSVRFHPQMEVIAPDGVVVGKAGEEIRLGGGISSTTGVLNTCEVNGRDWFSGRPAG